MVAQDPARASARRPSSGRPGPARRSARRSRRRSPPPARRSRRDRSRRGSATNGSPSAWRTRSASVHGSMIAEMVEVVAVERHVDPAPRFVGADPSPAAVGGRARRAVAAGRRRGASRMSSRGIVVHGVATRARCSGRSRRRRSRVSAGHSPVVDAHGPCSRVASSCQSAMWPTCSASDQSGPPASDGAAPGRCQAASSSPAQVACSRSHSAASSAHRSRSGARRSTARSVGQRRAAQVDGPVDRIGSRSASAPVTDPRMTVARRGRRSPRAGRRARRSGDRRPRPPRTGPSAAGRTRARGAPRRTSRRAR